MGTQTAKEAVSLMFRSFRRTSLSLRVRSGRPFFVLQSLSPIVAYMVHSIVGMSEADARRRVQELEAELDRRERAWAAREAALVARLAAAQKVLDAADERDDLADARDVAARKRGSDRDLADFRATGGAAEYADDRPERREAATGREHAKDDRDAAQEDRIALTEDLPGSDADNQPH